MRIIWIPKVRKKRSVIIAKNLPILIVLKKPPVCFSPIVCHGYGSVISIQKYAFLESQDERCLVNLERNVEITLKEHRKKMQDEGYRKDFSI